MPEKQIDCIRVKSRARQERSWLLWLEDAVLSMIDMAQTAAMLACGGCLAGIGFGVGLAIAFAVII